MNGRLRGGAAGLGLAFVLAIAFGATGVLTSKNERVALGASTTLTIITAPVLVRHTGGDFSAADDGSVLGPGDTIQTGDGGRAVLTYFEGSTVEIEPDSQLTIETAHANPDSSTVIVMQQELGTTWHVVTHLLQGGSRYEVHTTAATASVRGTTFTVSVDPDGTTTETTTEGVVGNSDAAGTSTVLTPPGLRTTTRPGETPAPPQPAPEPDRKVTVTVGDQNTLVVDSFGRANGMKDGTKVIQTPGAQLAIVDDHLVITLPDLPDGQVTTHFLGTSGSTDVTTKVEEQGNSAVQVIDVVGAGAHSVVDVKKGTRANTPTAEKKTDDNDASSPTVGEPLTPTEAPAAAAAIEHGSGNAPGTVAATSGTGGGSPTTGSVSNPVVNGPGTTPGTQLPIAPTTVSASNSNGTSTGASLVNGNGTGIAPVGPGAATSGTKPPIVPTSVGASNSNGTSTGTSPGTGNGKAPDSGAVTSGTGSGSPSTGNAGNSTGNGGGSPAASGGAAKSGASFTGNSGAILKDVLKDVTKGKAGK